MNVWYIVLAIVILLLLIFVTFLIIQHHRKKHFMPNPDRQTQLKELNSSLESTGFQYSIKGDYFYSIKNCWQREFGYCSLYDEACPPLNLIIDCEPIPFEYLGKHWLIELWKGQYGMTTGAEVGIYCTDKEPLSIPAFHGFFYESISDEENIPISFILKKKKKVILKRKDVHWWLTGFLLGEFSSPSELTLDTSITFPTQEMCHAFIQGLIQVGYQKHEYSVKKTTVSIHFSTPHTPQPITKTKVQITLSQQFNERNCHLYSYLTKGYHNTLDKLELLKTASPALYKLVIHSIYSRELYKAYELLKPFLHIPKPSPSKPPKPTPPTPCDPCCNIPAPNPCDPCCNIPAPNPCDPCCNIPAPNPCDPCCNIPAPTPCDPCCNIPAPTLCDPCCNIPAPNPCDPCYNIPTPNPCDPCCNSSPSSVDYHNNPFDIPAKEREDQDYY